MMILNPNFRLYICKICKTKQIISLVFIVGFDETIEMSIDSIKLDGENSGE